MDVVTLQSRACVFKHSWDDGARGGDNRLEHANGGGDGRVVTVVRGDVDEVLGFLVSSEFLSLVISSVGPDINTS